MAIVFTTANTFSANTVISSSQVNTNFSNITNAFNGLEAQTSTFTQLKLDEDPTIALEVATKQYVDHYSTWRRPVLQFVSTTTVTIETGNQGTSGSATINFPDGTTRSDSTASHLVFNITRNAGLTGTVQSGLRTSLSEATNTWYAIYAVKSQDNTTDFVAVGDTVLPLQANYAALNTSYGTNGWVYLGMIRNGDNVSSTGDILTFVQNGNVVDLRNVAAVSGGVGYTAPGTRLANTAGATSVTYTYAAGTGATNIPNHVSLIKYCYATAAGSGSTAAFDTAAALKYYAVAGVVAIFDQTTWLSASMGLQVSNGSSVAMEILLTGWIDPVLGVGSNPLL